MKKNIELNNETLAVVGINYNNSKIIELKKEYVIHNSSYEVMDNSCKYFGSSYLGRLDGSKKLLGFSYKLPIIVEESSDMIFFPTTSFENEECIWINLNWYRDVVKKLDKTYIILKNGKKIPVKASIFTIKNQVMRASRLNLILNDRKPEKNW